MSNVLTLPYEFEPRPYQLELFKAFDSGYKRAIAIYHRRAGKDKTLFNLMIRESFKRVGVYYYLFPEFAQGRRILWDGVDGSGFKFLDHIPHKLQAGSNSQDMKLKLINGSIIQIIGTDKFNKVRGANPIGCVFSEFGFQNPKAWNIIRPILTENQGWAIFNSTTNGKNHLYKLYNMARQNPNWFTQYKTVRDTVDNDGNRVITDEMIEEERLSGMSEELIQQEYYCSWVANSQGFYYLELIEKAEEEGRICKVPYDPSVPVETWWDIGFDNNTAIWFTQSLGKELHVIDFYTNRNRGIDYYAKQLQRKPYVYKSMNFPHDIKKTEFGTGRSIIEVAEELFTGIRVNPVDKLGINDGINAVRMILPQVYFDRVKCAEGLDCLRNYHSEYDEKTQTYKEKPKHDWASDAADAFRYLAVGISLPRSRSFRSEFLHSNIKLNRTKHWMIS